MSRPASFRTVRSRNPTSDPAAAAAVRLRLRPKRGGRQGIAVLGALLVLVGWIASAGAAEPPVPRPRIGLVLSGGGARGVAHIGILKVLEALRIPVDIVTGTSMGAIVGGFYASGSSPAELEEMVTSMEWNEAFKDRPPLEDLSFRRKEDIASHPIKFEAGIRDGHLALPLGLIQGQNLNFILKSRLIHTSGVKDFRRLRIPFGAVAADIETGEAVVLDRGDLATAMRASMSIPGVFSPVELDGRLLVDGGIADNLPIDVARKLGADILIAVNIGTLRRPREKLTSAMTITAQVMTILIQKNTDEQIATLGKGDLLIQPFLGEIGSSDFDRAAEAIRIGEAEAKRIAPRLAGLALPPDAYQAWLASQRREPFAMPVLASVTLDDTSPIDDNVIRAQIRTRPGQTLDMDTLEKDLKRIYGIDTFEKADFHLDERDGKTDLRIETRERSWGPNRLRFGLGFEDDFRGSAAYNLSASFTAQALNRLGAEWENQLQIGDTPHFFSEFYQPLDETLSWFVAPRIEYRSWNINAFRDDTLIAEYRATLLEGGFDVGRQFGNWGELRLGLRRGYGHADVRVGQPQPDIKFNTGALYTSFTYNRLDNFNFPRRGTTAGIVWSFPREELGSDYSGQGMQVNWLTARTWGRHTFLSGLHIQSALNSEAPLQNSYDLGGFLNLSGFSSGELSGQHTGLGRLIYYYQLGSTGLGEFRMPLYLGGSLEAGNAWATRGDISGRTLLFAGSLLVGAETYLGPLYLAYGQAEGGHRSIYLYLGHKF